MVPPHCHALSACIIGFLLQGGTLGKQGNGPEEIHRQREIGSGVLVGVQAGEGGLYVNQGEAQRKAGNKERTKTMETGYGQHRKWKEDSTAGDSMVQAEPELQQQAKEGSYPTWA